MDHLTNAVVSVAIAIVGLATIAVLVSRNANTTGVITAGGNAFSNALSVAESPVSGSSMLGGLSLGGITGMGAPIG